MLHKISVEVGMQIDEERLDMIVRAIGAAVVQIIADGNELSRSALIDQLERNRRETGNVIGKGVNRDAAELVRKGQ
jgi:methionine synthase II (cobalamin-independent)